MVLSYVALVTATLAFYITRVPIQLSDGGANMVSVADMSPAEIVRAKVTNESFFRPLMWPPYKLVMDASGGAYFAWFKAIHVIQIALLLLLFVRWLRIETAADLVMLPFGIAVLIGGHTFAGMVREAFPINHFLSIAICCLGAATLASEPRRVLNDVLAVLCFAYAVLTLETGLLVWVVLVWAFMLGWRGVSGYAVGAVTLGVIAYAMVRFGVYGTGAPGLIERSSGFGFSVLSTDELTQRFGERPVVFYAYNVVSAIVGALCAEPRGGVWMFVRDAVRGRVEPWMAVNVLCASGAALLVAMHAWRRRHLTRTQWTHGDRVVAMAPIVLVANAAFCYVYVKDVVLSVAGVFVAAAAAVAMRHASAALAHRSWPWRAAGVLALSGLAAGWAIKHVGVHYGVWQQGRSVRREWALADEWFRQQQITLSTPGMRAVKARLEFEALARPELPPWPAPRLSRRWLDETQ